MSERGATRLARALLIGALVGAAPSESLSQARRGADSNLPLPRFESLNADRANVRRGPGLSHRIDWVFLRRGAPLEVVAEHGNWRRVRDQDDAGGWMHRALLRRSRSAIVTESAGVALRADPTAAARVIARAEAGVVGRLESCRPDWCRLDVGAAEGWAPRSGLWGVADGETWD
mgnify:FL=1